MNNSLRKFTAGVTALMVMATMTSVAAFAEGETIPGASDTLPAGSSDTTLVPGVSETPVTPAPADNALTVLSESTPAEQSTGLFEVNGARYDTLQAAVNQAKNGGTVFLKGDAEGDGVVIPSGSELTIDFGGYTYTVSGQTVGSSGTETNGFQILNNNGTARTTVRMKNGTLTAVSTAHYNEKYIKLLVQNYSNLTLENMTLDARECDGIDYVLSNNCGNVEINGETNIYAASGNKAFDVYYWPSNGYTPGVRVTVNTTGTIDGDIEFGGDKSSNDGEKAFLVIEQGTIDGTVKDNSETNCVSSGTAKIDVTGGQFTDNSWVKDNYVEESVTVQAELKSGDATVGYYYGGTGDEIDATKLDADSVEITEAAPGANITVAGEDVTVTNGTENAIQVNGSQVAAGASTVVNREPTSSSDRDSDGGSGESELTRQRREEVNRLWKSTRNALRDAAAGDVITAEADEADNVPTYVLLPLYGRDVTLVVNHDGESYTLTDDSIGTISANQVYFTFEAVAEFDAGEETAE